MNSILESYTKLNNATDVRFFFFLTQVSSSKIDIDEIEMNRDRGDLFVLMIVIQTIYRFSRVIFTMNSTMKRSFIILL